MLAEGGGGGGTTRMLGMFGKPIGGVSPRTPPFPACHEPHHLCCKTRDCWCAVCSLSPSLTHTLTEDRVYIIVALLEMCYPMCGARTAPKMKMLPNMGI